MFIVAGVALGRFGGFLGLAGSLGYVAAGFACSIAFIVSYVMALVFHFKQRARHQNIFAFNGTWHDEFADTIPRVVLRAFNLGTEHRSGVAKNVGWLAHWTVAICRGAVAATIRQAAACTFVPASNDVSDCSKYDRIYSLVKMRMGLDALSFEADGEAEELCFGNEYLLHERC